MKSKRTRLQKLLSRFKRPRIRQQKSWFDESQQLGYIYPAHRIL